MDASLVPRLPNIIFILIETIFGMHACVCAYITILSNYNCICESKVQSYRQRTMTSLIYVHGIRSPISVPRVQSKKISRWLTGGGRFCQQKWDPRAVS